MSRSKDRGHFIKADFEKNKKIGFIKGHVSLLLDFQFQFQNMIQREDIHSIFSCSLNFGIKSLDPAVGKNCKSRSSGSGSRFPYFGIFLFLTAYRGHQGVTFGWLVTGLSSFCLLGQFLAKSLKR